MEAQEGSFLKDKWFVVVDDVVGGWAISTIDKPLSQMDYKKNERHWIECSSKSHAEYLVDLHNKTLS